MWQPCELLYACYLLTYSSPDSLSLGSDYNELGSLGVLDWSCVQVTPPPVGERSIVMSVYVSVCLFICVNRVLSAYISSELCMPVFVIFLHRCIKLKRPKIIINVNKRVFLNNKR